MRTTGVLEIIEVVWIAGLCGVILYIAAVEIGGALGWW